MRETVFSARNKNEDESGSRLRIVAEMVQVYRIVKRQMLTLHIRELYR